MQNQLPDFLKRGVEQLIDEVNFLTKLSGQRKLRIKLGIDPTSTDLHLGHMAVLKKLADFQFAGHQAVLIIGDFTAMIGDPTGRAGSREPLTKEQIKEHMKSYLKQAGKIINLSQAEVRYNSEWFNKFNFHDVLKLMGQFTLQQLTEREDIKKRIIEGKPVGYYEPLYSAMQAYDSVVLEADLELGGRDQLLNMLAGKDLMHKMSQTPQDVLTVPLILGTDGVQKMSKSKGNYIALMDEPSEMFGKIMSVPDAQLSNYYELLTDMTFNLEEHPKEAKLRLATYLVRVLHSEAKAKKAEANFVKTFSKKENPEDIQNLHLDKATNILDVLVLGGVASKGEARRLITQGGIKLDQDTVSSVTLEIQPHSHQVLKIGKHRFWKIG